MGTDDVSGDFDHATGGGNDEVVVLVVQARPIGAGVGIRKQLARGHAGFVVVGEADDHDALLEAGGRDALVIGGIPPMMETVDAIRLCTSLGFS